MDERRLRLLYQKHLEKNISSKEWKEFLLLLAEPEALPILKSVELEDPEIGVLDDDTSLEILKRILTEKAGILVHDKIIDKPKGNYLRYAAAAIIGFLLLGSYFWVFNKKNGNNKMTLTNLVIKDALPGQSGAILKLSNGQSILIDSSSGSTLVRGIAKSADGIYVSGASNIPYATLQTPLGRQQRLRLSDGTIVWLNAGSSIRFPTAFKGGQRIVEITGEVYFEVVHNEHQPFIVKAADEIIHDLGTHFDVNAYGDERGIKTTLIEGSVQIGTTVLKPGEQYKNGIVKKVNAAATVAWVNGFFHFEHADIKTVMNQISRWYNVQVFYDGDIPKQEFEGELERNLKLSQVLNLLTGTGIHYTLDGNKLIIRP